MPDYGINYKLYDLSSSGAVTPTGGGAQTYVWHYAPVITTPGFPGGSPVDFPAPGPVGVTLNLTADLTPVLVGAFGEVNFFQGSGTGNGTIGIGVDGGYTHAGSPAATQLSLTSANQSSISYLYYRSGGVVSFASGLTYPSPLDPNSIVNGFANFYLSAGSHEISLLYSNTVAGAVTRIRNTTFIVMVMSPTMLP